MMNEIRDSLLTPEEYYSSSDSVKTIILDKIKEITQFSSRTVEVLFYSDSDDQTKMYNHNQTKFLQEATVYRPFDFSTVPPCYQTYIPFITKKHPMGERKKFFVDNNLYDRLYAFVSGKCVVCAGGDQYWSEGDKDIEKCCSVCGDETFLVKYWNEY